MKRTITLQPLLVFSILLLCKSSFGQTTDSTKSTLNFSGTINANNNGFSLVPTFSLGKPAVQTGFNISGNKGFVNIRFEPYSPLLTAMRELNTHAHTLRHDHGDEPRMPAP